jgi:hypothetical protein
VERSIGQNHSFKPNSDKDPSVINDIDIPSSVMAFHELFPAMQPLEDRLPRMKRTNESSTKRNPRWYQRNLAVKQLLDRTDPGYRYWHPSNVESTNNHLIVHHQIKNLILGDTWTPLSDVSDERRFPWLLHGSEKDVRRVLELSGICPKLLHMFAQVSQLCATLQENPNSIVCLTAGEVLLKRLTNFWQWSDLVREPFASSEELFEVCKGILNEKGYVENDHLVAALTAEAYVHAAQAYLLCRLFRLSRKHTEVQKRSTALRRCVTYVPVNHVIYVAQDSIYSIANARHSCHAGVRSQPGKQPTPRTRRRADFERFGQYMTSD